MALILTSAKAVNGSTVVATFNTNLATIASTYNPANYTFAGGLTAERIFPGDLPNQVRIIVSGMQYLNYTLFVVNVQNVSSEVIVFPNYQASLTGWSGTTRFTARALSTKAVQILFAQPMDALPALSDPTKYTITTLGGVSVGITSAVPNELSGALRTRLNLSGTLVPGNLYSVAISEDIKTDDSKSLVPNQTTFSWVHPRNSVSVPLGRFTGEVRAPIVLDRAPTEVLTLQESLSVVAEVSRGYRNTTSQHEEIPDTFGNIRPLLFVESYDSVNEQTINSSNFDTWVLGSVRLVTDVRPFDPARPDFVTLPEQSLKELLIVEASGATRDLDVFITEKLTLSLSTSAERPFYQFSNVESLTLSEGLRVLPEVGTSLAESTQKLFGNPQGQVFFSPALVPSLPGPSTIQVDDVSVCTRSYDVYSPPKDVDPIPLYTHGGGITGSLAGSVLSPTVVLFGGFNVIGAGAHLGLSSKHTDTIDTASDEAPTLQMLQVYDPARFGLLNNPAWELYGGVALPFVVADNLSPIGAPVDVTP